MAPRERGYDRTTLRDIEDAGRRIAVECVIREPHEGGFVQLGWHNRLGVLMSGPREEGVEGNVSVVDE